jgi:hypothetical protein
MVVKEVSHIGKKVWDDYSYYKAIKEEILNRMKKEK